MDQPSTALPSPTPAPADRSFRVRPSLVIAGCMGLLFAAVAVLAVWQAFNVKPTSLYNPTTGQVVPAGPTGPGN